jgi:hypothetical protein
LADKAGGIRSVSRSSEKKVSESQTCGLQLEKSSCKPLCLAFLF